MSYLGSLSCRQEGVSKRLKCLQSACCHWDIEYQSRETRIPVETRFKYHVMLSSRFGGPGRSGEQLVFVMYLRLLTHLIFQTLDPRPQNSVYQKSTW